MILYNEYNNDIVGKESFIIWIDGKEKPPEMAVNRY